MLTPSVRLAVAALAVAAVLASGASPARAAPADVTPEDLAYCRELMKETWRYIDSYVSEITGLPYDSNQARDITNTTNVGLYLAALSMACKLGYVTEADAVARITKILDSLDRYQHWHRLYGNWLDPDGKTWAAKPGESNISDYNKLPAGLICIRQVFPQLADRVTAFLDEIPWEKFYEPGSEKICYAFDVTAKRVYNPVYFFRGEDKILGHFLMIASGKVPPSTWDRHDLSEDEKEGYKFYRHGWQGGGLFMQYICGLFLDDRATSLGRSAANFAWAQIVHGHRIGSPVWGWSACVAPDGHYLGMGMLVDEIVTPHASALAINVFPREVIDNLKRLESFNLRRASIVGGRPRKYGFRDAVNWVTGEMTDKYLVLDQAMLFLSLVNFCQDGLLWKTFAADPMVANGKRLIAEFRDAPSKAAEAEAYVASLGVDDPGVFWLSMDMIRVNRPGRTLHHSLFARSLSRGPLKDVRAAWQITGPGGRALHAGRHATDLAPRETRRVIGVGVPTDEAGYGDEWTLDTSCQHGGKTYSARKDTFMFFSYQDLAGPWKAMKGDDPAWSAPDFDDGGWTAMPVPMRWEDGAWPDYDGKAWYRLSFSVKPEDAKRWGDKPLAIALGAVDDADETYLNGTLIGKSGKFLPEKETAYNAPRLYPVDRKLLQDTNILAVRIDDWEGNGGIWRGPVAIGPAEELRKALER